MKFNIIIHFWGREYIKNFFDFTFPSLFFPGNISLLKKYDTTLTFCVNSKELITIKDSLKKFNLSKFVIRFVIIDNILKNYPAKKINHFAILKGFRSEKRKHNQIYFLILTADDIFSNFNFKYMLRILKKNKINGILENKLLVNKDIFIKKYKKLFSNKKGVSKRKLVSIGTKNISRFQKYSFPDEKRKFNYNSYNLLWRDGKNLICRGYLLHPLLIKPYKNINSMKSFCDYFLFPEYIKSFKKIYIFKSSDEFFRVGLDNNFKSKFIFNFNIKKYSSVLSAWTTKHHRKYANFKTVFKVNNNYFDQKTLLKSINTIKEIEKDLKLKTPKKHDFHPWWNTKLNQNLLQTASKNIKSLILRLI